MPNLVLVPQSEVLCVLAAPLIWNPSFTQLDVIRSSVMGLRNREPVYTLCFILYMCYIYTWAHSVT